MGDRGGILDDLAVELAVEVLPARGGGGIVVIDGLEQLFPAIPLDPKLLLGSPNFSGSIGVKVGLFKPLYEVLYIVRGGLNDGLFPCESGGDGSM